MPFIRTRRLERELKKAEQFGCQRTLQEQEMKAIDEDIKKAWSNFKNRLDETQRYTTSLGGGINFIYDATAKNLSIGGHVPPKKTLDNLALVIRSFGLESTYDPEKPDDLTRFKADLEAYDARVKENEKADRIDSIRERLDIGTDILRHAEENAEAERADHNNVTRLGAWPHENPETSA